jgi:RNA polymerase sigma-70 factor (ECF subfamily)
MDRDHADDLYQDTVLQAFTFADRIDSANNPKSFLFSIAVRKWKNEQRKGSRRKKLAQAVFLDDLEGMVADAGIDTERRLETAAVNDCIRRAFADMDDKFRIPMLLYYMDDHDLSSIAGICKIPQGTVKSRLSKGRSLMRDALNKEGYSNEP